jgi:hypothetical protein
MTAKPIELKAWMQDGTEHVVRYYREADYDALAARLAEAERLLSIKVPAGGINVNGVHIGKGCDLRTVASAIEGPRAAASAKRSRQAGARHRADRQQAPPGDPH